MVTLRANPRTGIQKTINFNDDDDDDGQGTTQQRATKKPPPPAQKKKKKKKQQQQQQESQPQQPDPSEQLSRFRESEDRSKDQGLSKRQRRKRWPGGKAQYRFLLGRDRAEKTANAKSTEPRSGPAANPDNANASRSSRSTGIRPLPLGPSSARHPGPKQPRGVMSGSGTIDNIIDHPIASAVHQNARNSGQSFVADEPDESRTAALGRKRKKGGDQRSQLATDKRPRLSPGGRSDGDDDWVGDSLSMSEGLSNRGSKESGEVSSGDDEDDDDDDYLPAAIPSTRNISTNPRHTTSVSSRASHITISDDNDEDVKIIPGPAPTKPNGPKRLTLDQLKPDHFREYVKREMKGSTSRPVEEVLRSMIESKSQFSKIAHTFLLQWEQGGRLSKGQVRAIRQQATAFEQSAKPDAPEILPDNIADIEAAFHGGLFSRPMNLGDLQSRRALQRHVQSLRVREVDILPVLCKVANDRAQFCTQARRALSEWSSEHYIGSQRAARVTNGPLQNTSEPTGQAATMGARRRQPVVSEAPSVGEAPDAEMENQVPALDPDNGESSDDDPSVGDSPMRASHDYGSLARDAAGFTPLNRSAPPPLVRMHDISEEEQVLQYRYCRISQADDLVRCLCCGELGHIEDDCPEHICRHCGAYGDHFSYNCPEYSKCRRCRQRGHAASACRNRVVAQPGGTDDPCDVCGRVGHVEEECARLWCSFTVQDERVLKVPESQIIKACYNCGGSDHFGDDCPGLPDYARGSQDGRVWSASNANRFTQVEQEPARPYGNGHGYQMAQLDDMRD